jgi:nucleoside-diphosphate-sugar epimerase
MKNQKIAILGASSHIAKGLIANFLGVQATDLHLYTRSPGKVAAFLGSLGKKAGPGCQIHAGYGDFTRQTYDVIINCIGVGVMDKLQGDFSQYFTVTEEYDNLVIDRLRDNCPDTLYISFSSGVVYGRDFTVPAEENTVNHLPVNQVMAEDYYAVARINSEAKHRSFKGLKIVDLRIFSYFSRYIDLSESYFITDVINALIRKKTLVTDSKNIVRDFIHPQDLFAMILKCMSAGLLNRSFDVSSAKPVSKREVLDHFAAEYGLKYETGWAASHDSPTGGKMIYCSNYHNAKSLGFEPRYTSLQVIKEEAKNLL